jgi:hypothetical protein
VCLLLCPTLYTGKVADQEKRAGRAGAGGGGARAVWRLSSLLVLRPGMHLGGARQRACGACAVAVLAAGLLLVLLWIYKIKRKKRSWKDATRK